MIRNLVLKASLNYTIIYQTYSYLFIISGQII